MDDETKATMERLGKMTFQLYDTPSGETMIGLEEELHGPAGKMIGTRVIGCLAVWTKEQLGLTPGMDIMILPVVHEEKETQRLREAVQAYKRSRGEG